MKKIKRYKEIIVLILIVVGIYAIYKYNNKPWQLSLYGDNSTLMRVDYKDKNTCLSAGRTYYQDGSTQYKRFDCGYKCSYVGNEKDLTNSPICQSICDNYGCK